jgi:hypothetical protein
MPDIGDVVLIMAFLAALLSLAVYVWRSERPRRSPGRPARVRPRFHRT